MLDKYFISAMILTLFFYLYLLIPKNKIMGSKNKGPSAMPTQSKKHIFAGKIAGETPHYYVM